MQVGNLMKEWREFEQASEFYRRAFEMRRLSLGPDDPDTLTSLGFLALTTYLNGHVDAARGLAEDWVARLSRTRGPEAKETVMAHKLLARVNGQG
jgi:hypothetical protein